MERDDLLNKFKDMTLGQQIEFVADEFCVGGCSVNDFIRIKVAIAALLESQGLQSAEIDDCYKDDYKPPQSNHYVIDNKKLADTLEKIKKDN